MKIAIISPGKQHDPDIVSAIEEFTSRISRYAPVEWKLIGVGKDAKEEAVSILKSVADKDIVVLLDERGTELSSTGLSQFIEKRLNESTQKLAFIIGGAYGVDDSVKERANFIWSLSKLVFPHQLVRLILVEQLYRAFSILKGEKYHHE